MSFENRAGVFVVQYDSPAALDPAHQHDLVAALRSAAVVAPVGVVFAVAPAIQSIDRAVPEFWLTVTSDKAVRIAAMAVVTSNPGVSVATRGFSTINILRDTTVPVKPFPDADAAIAWVREELAKRR
jgi:hypothetical protein